MRDLVENRNTNLSTQLGRIARHRNERLTKNQDPGRLERLLVASLRLWHTHIETQEVRLLLILLLCEYGNVLEKRQRPTDVPFLRDLLRFSVPGGVVSAIGVLAAYGVTRSLPGRNLEDARSVALMVLVFLGLYLILLLEDEAMEQSNVRSWGVGVLMLGLLIGFAVSFAVPPIADFFAISPPDLIEWLVVIGSAAIGIGALGALGFHPPHFLRKLVQRSPDQPS